MTFSCRETRLSVLKLGQSTLLHVGNIVLRLSEVVGVNVEDLVANTLSLNPAILVLTFPSHEACQVWRALFVCVAIIQLARVGYEMRGIIMQHSASATRKKKKKNCYILLLSFCRKTPEDDLMAVISCLWYNPILAMTPALINLTL